MNKFWGRVGALWGVLGLTALLGWAVYRVYPFALEATHEPWRWYEMAFFIFWMVFMLYGEGYKGFQKGFSPRVVARAAHLSQNPVWWHVLLAPLYCMGYIHATRKRRIVALSVTTGIIVLIVAVHWLPQPWRGIVDMGVVSGLIYGIGAMWAYAIQALIGREINHPTDVPTNGSMPMSPPSA
jgi:hypothetical protein